MRNWAFELQGGMKALAPQQGGVHSVSVIFYTKFSKSHCRPWSLNPWDDSASQLYTCVESAVPKSIQSLYIGDPVFAGDDFKRLFLVLPHLQSQKPRWWAELILGMKMVVAFSVVFSFLMPMLLLAI
mmetsp:Transcript_40661/g.49491  ORF Transcript_40661/g.49491 Transcript_40661/m.49491 type:complete len:127 (+) Transcript_40661:266-646(+)